MPISHTMLPTVSDTALTHKMQEVPAIELSYENTTPHKKVPESYQIGLAIPRSKKYVAWFTFIGDQDVCILLELNREKHVVACRQIPVIFDTEGPHLALGTLLYGSIVYADPPSPVIPSTTPPSFFVVEDILLYRGVSTRKLPFGDRLGILYHLLHTPTLLPPAPSARHINFRLPLMFSATEPVPPQLPQQAAYKIHHIQYRSLTKILPYLNFAYGTQPRLGAWNEPLPLPSPASAGHPTPRIASSPTYNRPHPPPPGPPRRYVEPTGGEKAQFWVTADLQSDIYHLEDPRQRYQVDVAYIPNYRVSVFMNTLFRRIKENQNLDDIEHSDDEDEFYDTRVDKYLQPNQRLFMEFVYHKKFRRWIPIRVVRPGQPPSQPPTHVQTHTNR